MMTRRASLPPVVTGSPLDDIWSVIVPIARTNEISNPSLETNTTGYTAGAGSLARSTAQQYHGTYSAAYTPSAATTDGFYYTFTATVALRAVSCKFLGQKGVPYALAYASTAPVELAIVSFVATGRWQWIWLYVNETSATSRRIYFRKNGSANLATFYVDGVQSEVLASAAETVSTYLDGDQLGLVPNQLPPAYLWNGTPHASTSSRSGLSRAGGIVLRFKDYGFLLTAIVGLGLAIPQNVASEYARIDGGYDDYTRKPTRQFTLTGRVSGRNYMDLRALRSAIGETLDRDLVAQDQRLTLLHHIEDSCGNVQTNESRILCKYQGGFGGNTDNQIAETLPLTFTQYLPNVLSDSEAGLALTVNTSTSVAAITERTAAGVWQALGTGLNSSAQDILIAKDGSVYVTGQFTTAGGGAAAGIAKWSGTAWSALGTGLTGGGATGYALAQAPNGDIYVGGDFTDAGGSGADYIAKWDGAAWSVVGSATAINNIVRGLAIGPTGIVYAGGDFTNAGGDPNADRIAQWSGAAWSSLGTGMDNIVRSMVVLPDGTIYAGGDFATADGNAAVRIAKWNGTAWSALSTGLTGGGTNRAFKLILGKNGVLYVGGTFTAAGGVSASNIASWNGVTFFPLGSGTTPADLRNMVITPDNQIIVTGDFTSAGGFGITGGLARWTGSAWVSMDSDLAAGPVAAALALSNGGDLYSSANTATMLSSGLTTITNIGTAKAYPTIVIKGPSASTARIYSITNPTTGRAVYLNLTLNVGETARLVFTPDNLSFTSDFQGNIANAILPGSTVADFFLQPGSNTIAFFTTSTTVTALISWRPAFVSLDDVN